MIIKDTVFEVYPDNVSAELIAHTRHVSAVTPEGLSAACMKDVDPDFHKKMEKGGIMIAGSNFGCNSSREWAPAALLYSGVKLIVARSFSRIFYRSAINIGLPILECKDLGDLVQRGDYIEVDLSTGSIRNISGGRQGQGTVLPPFLLDIMTAGGLMEKLKTGAA
jgi:3-isopropylmalate/(R)-2-methylmalate dehydratase small subunit